MSDHSASVFCFTPLRVPVSELAAFWARSMRLRIEGDEVQVVYPFLRGWRNRAYRFGEIASVEVSVVDKDAKRPYLFEVETSYFRLRAS